MFSLDLKVTTLRQIRADKICYFSDWCLQASTQTATCPRTKLQFMFHARLEAVKTRRYFKFEFTDLARQRPSRFTTICLQSSSQHVGSLFTGCPRRRDWLTFHCSLSNFKLTLDSNWKTAWVTLKRCPARQKVNFLPRCPCPTSWEKKKKHRVWERQEMLASAVPLLTTLCN